MRAMRTQRGIVDYAMRRRAVLADVQAGRASLADVCDAQPYLLSAARYHGEPSARPCPVCDGTLTDVHFIYGDELGRSAGQARALRELPVLAMSYAKFSVYVVEVCPSCAWNHLRVSYTLGREGLPVEPDGSDGSDRAGQADHAHQADQAHHADQRDEAVRQR